MLNTCGLYVRRNKRATEDSAVIALMRKAGAIPFALTNVPECCMWWESFNTVHGRTSNAYDSNRIVGGSSGGEGALQSIGGSPFGIGSDIGGSIRIPATFNGVFGHKPSKFIVSNAGQHPIATEHHNSFLSTGPMCRYAADLKPMLKILTDKKAESLKLDEPVDIKKIRFFYQEDDCGGELVSPVDPDLKEAMEKVVKYLRETVKADVTHIRNRTMKYSAPIWFAGMKEKDAPGFDLQLTDNTKRLNVGLEFAKWFIGQSKHTFVALFTILLDTIGIAYGSPVHKEMLRKEEKLSQEFKEMLSTDGILLYPVHPTVAPYHSETIVRAMNFSYTGIINILGLPATAIPLGLGRQGLPLGLQAVGGLNQDRLCLAVAEELEKAFGGWVPPEVHA